MTPEHAPTQADESPDNDEDHPGIPDHHEPPDAPDWTDPNTPVWVAEIELRRHLSHKYPDIDWKPDLRRAEHFNPRKHYPNRGPDGHFYPPNRTYEPKIDRHAALKALEQAGLQVEPDKITIPYHVDGKKDTQLVDEDYDVYLKKPRLDDGYANKPVPLSKLVRVLMDDEDPRPIYTQQPPTGDLAELQSIQQKRRSQNRDFKVLVTARDSETGTGKTTLAYQLAQKWSEPEWNPDDHATLDPQDYADAYTSLPPGSFLLGDEMEQMADNRRSMSTGNLALTHLWSTMRYRQVGTICTLPTVSMLDKRLKELADVRIHVHQRGVAVAYKVKIDDHSGELRERRLHRIRWGPADNDPAYERLNEMKAERMENYGEHMAYGGDDGDPEQEVRRDARDDFIQAMNDHETLTQAEISEILEETDSFDKLGRSAISKVANADGDV